MLTRQGWAVGIGGIAVVLAGRLLGVFELFVAGTALVALLVITAIVVGLARLDLEVARELHPPSVHAGAPSRVDLKVRNRGARRTPVLRLRDAVSGTRGARLLLGPLRHDQTARAAYRLPTERRGILTLGPLDVVLGDPFGLTEVSLPGAGVSELTVYPHIDSVVPVRHTTGDDPHGGAEHPNSFGRTGEDFYALRHYVVGDDLRRVHWPATARHDELMVRQDELPWQGRATVLVDVRRATTTPESLELGISAAASIVTASWQREDLVRLVSTDGADSGFATGHAQMQAIMEHLATVEAAEDGAFRRIVDRLARSAIGGALVAVVSGMGPPELEALARLRHRFGSLTIVRFEPSSWDPSATDTPGRYAPGVVVPVTASLPFPLAWDRAMGSPLGPRPTTDASAANATFPRSTLVGR
jgi:uncharacterized protein (DUF58 family)